MRDRKKRVSILFLAFLVLGLISTLFYVVNNQSNFDIRGRAAQLKSYKPNLLPGVGVGKPYDIKENSAMLRGNVYYDGGYKIIENGFVYSESKNPMIGNATKVKSWRPGTGGFSIGISGLKKSTIYYFKPYAINEKGTAYGPEKKLQTLPVLLPVVTTRLARSIGENSASLGGQVMNTYGRRVLELGVVYSDKRNPTLTNSKKRKMSSVAGDGTVPFSTGIQNLKNDTAYYFRAYAINDQGVGYGSEQAFVTGEKAPYTIKAISLAYYPLDANGMLDKQIIQPSNNDYDMNLEQVQNKVLGLRTNLELLLERGSRFRAYSNPDAKRSIDYVVLEHKEYNEALPRDENKDHPYEGHLGKKMNDYRAIVNRENICNWVDNKGVSQVWLWGHQAALNGGFESNMSSKYGDISNSDRDNEDMPICTKPYVLYEFNYGREIGEAVHSQMHQLENLFGHLDSYLFWDSFAGADVPSSSIKRCGNVHFPPNGSIIDYDYSNKDSATSDCMDWKPDARIVSRTLVPGTTSSYTLTWDESTLGKRNTFNCDKWGCTQEGFLVFWMQNMPGLNNGLTYMRQSMPNWWGFLANLDKSLNEKKIVNPPSFSDGVYWSLDDVDLKDFSNEHPLRSLGKTGDVGPRIVRGKKGNAVEFKGDVGYRLEYLPLTPDYLKGENLTVMAYIKLNGGPCGYDVCSVLSRGSSGYKGFNLSVKNGKLNLVVNDNAESSANGRTSLKKGVWYHVAGTYNKADGNLKVYVNGVLDGSGRNQSSINYGDAKLRIGNANYGADLQFNGVIDEVRFFDKVLTQSEISSYLLP